jgi:hypothetical protein
MKVPDRKFDFSLDYNAINELGGTLYDLAKQARGPARKAERAALMSESIATFQRTLTIDSENVVAHYNLQQLYANMKDSAATEAEREQFAALAEEHHQAHLRYKDDDNIRGRAISEARKRYPAANSASEALVIYPLQRGGAPELPADVAAPPVALEVNAESPANTEPLQNSGG